MKKRLLIIGIVSAMGLLIMALVAPVAFAAASDSQVLAVLGKVIEGIIDAGKDGYCAMGVTFFCV